MKSAKTRFEFTVQPDGLAKRMPKKGETIKVNDKSYILDAVMPCRRRRGPTGWPEMIFVCHAGSDAGGKSTPCNRRLGMRRMTKDRFGRTQGGGRARNQSAGLRDPLASLFLKRGDR